MSDIKLIKVSAWCAGSDCPFFDYVPLVGPGCTGGQNKIDGAEKWTRLDKMTRCPLPSNRNHR